MSGIPQIADEMERVLMARAAGSAAVVVVFLCCLCMPRRRAVICGSMWLTRADRGSVAVGLAPRSFPGFGPWLGLFLWVSPCFFWLSRMGTMHCV
jgi:hypothetical protein